MASLLSVGMESSKSFVISYRRSSPLLFIFGYPAQVVLFCSFSFHGIPLSFGGALRGPGSHSSHRGALALRCTRVVLRPGVCSI